VKIYLDNSIIGRLVDITQGIKPPQPRLEEDMTVLPDLIALCRERNYVLCISVDAEIEISKVERPDRRQRLLQELHKFELLPPIVESDAVSLAEALEKFLLSKTRITRAEKKEALEWDARHLASCRLNGCDVFLTTDYGSIWAYCRSLKRIHAVNVMRPVELYQEMVIPETKTEKDPFQTRLEGRMLYNEKLVEAGEDLRYLLNRGYKRRNIRSLLKLVGDRYGLNKAQRNLLDRAVFADKEVEHRRTKLVNIEEVRNRTLGIDGYNVLVTLESALDGEPLILADDGLVRDIAGKSSRYKPSEITYKAFDLILDTLREYPPAETLFLFDEKMSMSLKLSQKVRGMVDQRELIGDASVSRYPDREILEYEIIATSDSSPIDKARKVFDLAGYVVKQKLSYELIRLG